MLRRTPIERARSRLAFRLGGAVIAIALLAGACGGSVEGDTGDTTSTSDGTQRLDANSAEVPSATPPAATTAPHEDDATQADDELATALASIVPAGSPGAIVRVDVAGETIVEAATGEVAFDSGRPLTTAHPFRLASTTKPITAATVLRLQEEGSLSIDDLVSDHLPADLVAQLHVVDGVSRGEEITIRHLLDHSSGLADRPFDTPFVEVVGADPGRVWEPRELVEFGITHAGPFFEPGTNHSYSDDGYVLLGMIIEEASGFPLHEAYRELVLDPLGMDETYLEGHEEPRGPEMSHPYYGELDGTQIHPSTDWGGGGLVSTVSDLVRFGTAIADGTLFEQPATLEAMTTDHGHGYGLGLYVSPLDGGLTALAHDGFWGAVLVVIPELDYVLAATVNQFVEDDDEREGFVTEALDLTLSMIFDDRAERPEEIATVEVDGRLVAYSAGGTGSATVVFEAGVGGGMESWTSVSGAVGEHARFVLYDRPGYGDSEPTDEPRDGATIVAELRATLSATGHEPPYVLVGHSLGGMLMELFARTHPDEVAGLVLVDSRPAEFTERCAMVFDVAGCTPSGDVLDAAPEPVRSEALALRTTEEQVQAAPPLGELAAAVIAAEASSGDPQTDALWLEVQRELAADLGVELIVADGSGHNVQHERPDLVTDVIVGLLGQL